MRLSAAAAAFALGGLGIVPCRAQSPIPPEALPGENLTVYLVTFGPGPAVWERFGHNAIWIRDRQSGEGPAYDYGRFDFNEEHFFLRFAQGRMRYWMGRADGAAVIEAYRRMGRSIALQEIALAPAARVALRDSLEADLSRDRGIYTYDYYLANCSTRLRDALDFASDGAIRRQLATAPGHLTWRDQTRRSLERNLFFYTLVMMSLGPETDRPTTAWEDTFLPGELRRHLRDVSVPVPGAGQQPLVREEQIVVEAERWPVPAVPGRWPAFTLLAVGLVLGGLFAGLGRLGVRQAWARRGFVTLAAGWEVVATLASLALIWFWFLSEHTVAHGNANVLHFNLLAGLLLIALAGVARSGRVGRGTVRLAALVAGCSLAAPLIQGISAWSQSNAEVAGLAIPAHLGVLAGLIARAGARSPGPSGAPPGPQ